MSYYGSNPSSPHTTNYRSYTGKPSTGPPTAPRPNPPAQNGYYQAIRPPVSSPPRHAHTHHAQPARVVEDEYLQDETVFFEQNRIKQLKNERIHIQKKTFTKWVNSYLNRVRLEIRDLFTDFGDGILLMKFLEIISGEKLGKPNRGQMRVQKIENLNRCLEFLKHKRIQLENIGAVDILDKNEDLILGLVWTIILRFTIENIEIEAKESGEKKRAKEALLLWVQRKVVDYPNVKVTNFTSSWRDGMAFNALIHAHRRDLINYDSLNPQDAMGNLNSAFDVAEKKLDIARLLDAEDINVPHPDEKSIITYVSLYYHYFAKQKTEMTGARRVGKVVGDLLQQDQLQDEFEQLSSDILVWIQNTINWLTDRNFPNSLSEMQAQLVMFNDYRKNEKPSKYKEKGDLEALFFAIQTKRKAMNIGLYNPPQGLFIHDVETKWGHLDHAENQRQMALIKELQRQERLELQAHTFYRKADMREQWLNDIVGVLSGVEIQPTAQSVESSAKMIETINTEVSPKADRFRLLTQMSNDLQKANYHGAEGIRRKEREVNDRWARFQALLAEKKGHLDRLTNLTALFRDMDTLSAQLAQLEPAVRNRDVGKHLLAVDDLLQKHELVITDLNAAGEWLKKVTTQSLNYIKSKGEQFGVVENKLQAVANQHAQLVDLCQEYHRALLQAKDYYRFIQDIEDEINWVHEKIHFCKTVSRDLNNIAPLGRQFKTLENEMQSHWQRNKEIADKSRHILANAPPTRDEATSKIQTLKVRWDQLREESDKLARWLSEAEQASQYFQEANDAESWIKEKLPLAKSTDYGRDLLAAISLTKRHAFLENDINGYRNEITRLDEMAANLAKSKFFSESSAPDIQSMESEIEEVMVPRVQVMYAYDRDGITVTKGEVLALLDMTNADWWRILKQDGVEGFVPANYCKVLPGETITVSHRVPKNKIQKPAMEGGDALIQRQEAINQEYRRLVSFAQTRRRFLADAVKLFKFCNECDDFEQWAKETQALISENTSFEHIAAFRQKFSKLENEVATNGGSRLKEINDMAEELITDGHSKSDNIRVRQARANQIWNDLQKMLNHKAENLEAAERLSDFNENCDDMRSWMHEKFALLSQKPESGDLRALQALQRHYQNLKRDLVPLKDRMNHLRKLGDEIKRKHPEHARETDRILAELGAMHDDLERQAKRRIDEAEQSQGQQLFENAARELLNWTSKTKQQMLEEPVGGEPAEDLVKRHLDLRAKINAKEYEFDYVKELAQTLLRKDRKLPVVVETLEKVYQAKDDLEQAWRHRDNEYRQLLELQVFNREAERIDALTKGQEAFLDINNLGDTVEGVENLLKTHADFDQKLHAQEDRVTAFCNSADSLIHNDHAHGKFIARRRDEVLQRRQNLYATAQQRRARLDDALVYQNLKRDADELRAWISDKKRIAQDDSFKNDPATLDRRLLKHEAFIAELKANGAQLQHITQEGQALIAQQHFESPQVAHILDDIDAFLLQTEGRKHWKVYAPSDKDQRPLEEMEEPKDNLVFDGWLNAGDLLYLPRGFIHCAHTDSKHDSLHVTTSAGQSHAYCNLIEKVTSKLLEAETAEIAQLRRSLPVDLLDMAGVAYTTYENDSTFPKFWETPISLYIEQFQIGLASAIPASVDDIARDFMRKALPPLLTDYEKQHSIHGLTDQLPAAPEPTKDTQVRVLRKHIQRLLFESENKAFLIHQLENSMRCSQCCDETRRSKVIVDVPSKLITGIEKVLHSLSSEWQQLSRLVDLKSHKLEEADDKKALERLIKDAHSKLDEIEAHLKSNEQGSNLRNVKELIQKKNAIDQEILLLEKKVADISAMGQEMIQKRHYDSPAIQASIDRLVKRFNALQDPLDRRQLILDESLKWHQLAFDVDVELQWIAEKKHVINSQDTGRSLTEALNAQKKHDQLEVEVSTHEPRVTAISYKGKELINANHMSSKWIRAKCDELESNWKDFKAGVRRRKSLLDWAVKNEQFLADVAEVELWIGDKQQQVLAKTNDVDMFVAERVLGWLKSTQKDMHPYKDNLSHLRSKAEKIAESEGNKDSIVLHRQAEVEETFNRLEELTNEKCYEMQNLISLRSYNQESQDLETWINDQLQTAMCEDYGQDFEHLQDLKSKFADFKQNVQVGSERSVLCEKTANDLLMRSPPFARDVLKRQEKLRSAWSLLLDYIDSRSKKLDAASQLHCFNQSVQDLHEMLNEKRVTLPVDYGRDTKQVYNLILKHEVFQTEVAQMHEKLQKLLEEGAQLKDQYPGPNAENIDTQLAELSQSYHQLNDASVHRTNKLLASYDLQKFTARARDFISWTSMAIGEMQDEQGSIKDLQQAEYVQTEHQRLQAEIRARDDEAKHIQKLAQDMIGRQHYAAKEIERKAHECHAAYAKTKSEWTLRNEWLQQVVQWHGYQREAAQILDTIRAKDETLNARRPMTSVEDVASYMRQFDTFSKSLAQVENRVQFLDQLASRLITEKHMEAKSVSQINENVQTAQRKLFDRMDTVRHELEDALRLARFDTNVQEMSNWVDEKLVVLRKQTTDDEFRAMQLEDKLAQLRQHQAMEIQLSANVERIQSIKEQFSVLKRHSLPENVEKRTNLLLKKWDELNERSKLLSLSLAEARQLFDFHQSVQRVLSWIREKQLMLQAQDVGRDFEHCTALLDKLIGKNADQSVDDATLKQVNRLGAQLVAEGRESRADVQQRLKEMNDAWSQLQGRIEHYREMLQAALEVHRFNGDVDETNARIHEKSIALQAEDHGKDLREVEELLRKQDKIERDMTAIHNKLNEHDEAAKLLLAKEPPLSESIITSLKTLETSWHNLAEAAHTRRLKLQQLFNLHRYFDSVKKMEQWAQQIRTRMRSYVHPKSVEDARQLLSAHAERQVEIESRQTEMGALREFGQQVTAEQPDHRSEIQRTHRRLQNIEHQIRQTWETENTVLQKMLELQALYAQILQTESWLSSKEAFVNEYDLGDSVDTVDMLIRKHHNFEKTLHAQSDKIEALRSGQHILEDSNNPDVEKIRQQFDSVLERYTGLLESCRIKSRRLEESRKLHEFIRVCSELITFMNAKLQLAYDDGYIDPTNLRSKLRKHLASDAELQQSEHRVQAIREDGEKLLKESHYESERVQAQLNEVLEGWAELRSKSQKKTKLLQESYEAHQLACRVGELDNWLDRVEHDLGTENHGVDVQSVEKLIEKHNLLKSEIEAKAAIIHETVEKANHLKKLQYENIDDQLRRVDAVKHRYHDLNEPCQIRAENLAESLLFFGWAADADEQLIWVNDKLPQLKSKDYGNTLHSAQSLNKKQEILQQEIDAHRVGIADVGRQGQRMLDNRHFNVNEIQSRLTELDHNFGILTQLNVERSKRLAESLRSQQYYAELSEAEQWCRERLPLVSNQDTGNNQTAADAHLRRIMALEHELGKFEVEVKRLHEVSDAMIDEHHFDSTHLTSRQASLEKLMSTLHEEWHRRRSQLLDASRYYSFMRQVNDLTLWLNDKERLALREDYGVDLEECRALIDEFELAIRELSASGERLHSVINYAKQEQLLRSGHPYEASIYNAVRELEDLWRRINNLANERQQALQDAQKIHIFDQEADEILIRLEEKEAHIVALDNEDLTNVDLATVKGLCQKHDEFLKSLHGIEKQVLELCSEADRLSTLFPQTMEHLEVRRSELTEQLKDIVDAARKFSERLNQARNKQAYFQEWRELVTWIQHMKTTIIGEILPRDLVNCEALNVRHGEYHTEIQHREPQKNAFVAEGRRMIQDGNALSQEINSRIEQLEEGFGTLYEFWHARQRIYEENYDAQKWLHTASLLEKWLAERENLLAEDWRHADNVDQVEDMIRQYEDFLATLDAQGPQFEALRRMTKIEDSWNRMRAHEGSQIFASSSQNVSRRESSIGAGENRRDTQQIKMVEKKNILQEKRQERERRKTQEITLLKRTPSQENNSLNTSAISSATLPRARNRTESIEAPIVSSGTSSDQLAKLSTSNAELGRFNSQVSAAAQQLHIATAGASQHQQPVHSQLSAGSSSGGDRPNSVVGSLFGSNKSKGINTRRTQKMKQWSELKSIDMNGYVDRKQELQSGGKKATIRSWKNYYVILCGQLLCFFKDEETFFENMAAAAPIYILNARCLAYPEYAKRKHTFKLNSTDGSEYLFSCESFATMMEWIDKINFHARLDPSHQLMSYNGNSP